MIDSFFVTTRFIKNYKKLVSQHKDSTVNKIDEIVETLKQLGDVSKYNPHPMNGNKEVKELHVEGNVLLTYRYSSPTQVVIDLTLYDVLDTHDDLQRNVNKKRTKKYVSNEYDKNASLKDIINNESLEEDFQVWGKAADSRQELFRKFEDRTGLRAGNPIWVVKENTYDPATKTTKAEFKNAGVRLQKGNNGTWIPYFTDGDHGYDCEEVEITPNDIEIEQVTNEYNRQFPIIFLGYDAVEKLSKIVKDANDKRIAAAKQQFASVQPTSYSKPIINSPLGERNARIKFKATVDDVEKRDYSYSNYWWGARDYDFYKMTDSNGNRLVVNVSSGKELPQDGEHEYIGTIQDAYIDKKTGDVVTRISRIRQLDESIERSGNLSLNESGFPEVSEKNRKRLAESLLKEEDCDEVIINIKEDGCIGKLHELRAKGYETAWAGEGKICMRKCGKKQVEEDLDNSELIYGKYELVPVEE